MSGSIVIRGHESSFVNARGSRIQTKTWCPDGDPIAVVVFLHGWGMSATNNNAWQRVADAHTARGLLCAGLDYSGHGRSEGKRSYVFMDDVSLIVDDVLQLVEELAKSHASGLPVFLRGQSLGGIVALMAALRRPDLFVGLALGAPPYEFAGFLGVLARWNLLVRLHAVPAASAYVRENIGSLSLPVAVFQGLEDGTCAAAGARRLVRDVGSADRSLYLYKNMGHNMSIEPDVLDWLVPRASAQAAPSAGATLYFRRPMPGLVWPPPPGDAAAAANTLLEEVRDPEEQRCLLDDLLSERGDPL